MRSYIQYKERAISLRSGGKTYSEIKDILGIFIPKSTLSNWCQSAVLPKWYMKKVESLNKKNLSKALRIARASNEIKRDALLNDIRLRNIEILNTICFEKDILRMILSVLHFAEGAKWKSHKGLLFGNSDPNIIKLYVRLLSICYDITPKDLKCRIGHRADQNLMELQEYWSRTMGVPLQNFYKSIPDPRTIGKPTKDGNYKGVCVIMGGSTTIQLELEMIPELILDKIRGPIA
jgi:hypothetical protein